MACPAALQVEGKRCWDLGEHVLLDTNPSQPRVSEYPQGVTGHGLRYPQPSARLVLDKEGAEAEETGDGDMLGSVISGAESSQV